MEDAGRETVVIVEGLGASFRAQQLAHGTLGHPESPRELALTPVVACEVFADFLSEGFGQGFRRTHQPRSYSTSCHQCRAW